MTSTTHGTTTISNPNIHSGTDMNTFNPMWAAIRQADKRIVDGAHGKMCALKAKKKAKEFINGWHKYQLHINRVPTDTFAVMQGFEGKQRNETFMKEFREKLNVEIDEGVKFGQTKTPYYWWVAVEKFVNNPNEQNCTTIDQLPLVLSGRDPLPSSNEEGREGNEGHGLEGCPQDGALPISDQCDSDSGQAQFGFMAGGTGDSGCADPACGGGGDAG